MNRGVYLKIENDEWLLGTARELLDPSRGQDHRAASAQAWMAISWALAELVYESEDETTATFTIEIR